ncbi:hypothetical protein CYLTODRAFT_378722 [Cylindrobasidium torrendii FP15055 ss-10]|uniref:STB6-like N-terminal domain-containing protein n=1 Tax=Cylindrobasidium torrendii FP15055 ss-10 TaxID=1314674 RepID=A0A0D7B5M7_9AGAR|nr:hypothetical protein CYLTODRAFT_378722 [Cylindrobasidium torrendii FP15055 ss-10]
MRDAVHEMRRDGRPKQITIPSGTSHEGPALHDGPALQGILMVTSLAQFRSDYTLVRVPDGAWNPKVRQRLVANINLLRLNVAGRTALTLAEPSESTKERFYAAYLLPPQEKDKDKDKEKDKDKDGAREQEKTSVGGSSTSTSVLELVKLLQASLFLFGFDRTPQDGLLCDGTLSALSAWASQHYPAALEHRIPSPALVAMLLSTVFTARNRLAALHHGHLLPKDPFASPTLFSIALSNLSGPHTPNINMMNIRTPSATPILPSLGSPFITTSLVDSLLTSEPPETPSVGAGSIVKPTDDLHALVATILPQEKMDSLHGIVRGIGKGRRRGDEEGKEIGGVVRALWSGGGGAGVGTGSSAGTSAGKDESDWEEGDDLFIGKAWKRKRVKDKLESWTGIGGRRRHRNAVINEDDDQLSSGQVSPSTGSPNIPFQNPPLVPNVIITSESSQTPPQSATSNTLYSGAGPSLPAALRARRPTPNSRATSWSIPQKVVQEDSLSSTSLKPFNLLSRRRSFPPYLPCESKVLPIDHMRLDVALAGEYLVMYRREMHLEKVLQATDMLNSRLVGTSAHLRNLYSTLEAGEDVSVLGVLDTERVRGAKMMQGVNTLWYEAEQMGMRDAWTAAVEGRRKVVEVRGKVFGTRAGATPSDPRADQVRRRKWKGEARQWRVNGEDVMVDRYGRTESEAEEEGRLEDIFQPQAAGMDDLSEDVDTESPTPVAVAGALRGLTGEPEESSQPVPVAWRPMWLLRVFTSWGRFRDRTAKDR